MIDECSECGEIKCVSPWCELDRMGWDQYLERDAYRPEENPFQIEDRWYFYDADSGRHGPFTSERASWDAACEWLADVRGAA